MLRLSWLPPPPPPPPFFSPPLFPTNNCVHGWKLAAQHCNDDRKTLSAAYHPKNTQYAGLQAFRSRYVVCASSRQLIGCSFGVKVSFALSSMARQRRNTYKGIIGPLTLFSGCTSGESCLWLAHCAHQLSALCSIFSVLHAVLHGDNQDIRKAEPT